MGAILSSMLRNLERRYHHLSNKRRFMTVMLGHRTCDDLLFLYFYKERHRSLLLTA